MTMLLHLTDTHLYADPGRELKEVNTRQSFRAVQEVAMRHHGDANLLILGGDLAQDEAEESYRYLAHELERMRLPYVYVPGNHDGIELMCSFLGESPSSQWMDGWQLIFLNTHVDGEVAGFLSDTQLQMLEKELSASSDRHQLIVMHHHPVPIGCDWLDEIGLLNHGAFWNIVDRFPSVRCVLFGHAHQFFDSMRGNVRLLCTPSTSIQFMPKNREFRLDRRSPGYRWLKLLPDGSIETDVERVIGFIPVDLNDTIGY